MTWWYAQQYIILLLSWVSLRAVFDNLSFSASYSILFVTQLNKRQIIGRKHSITLATVGITFGLRTECSTSSKEIFVSSSKSEPPHPSPRPPPNKHVFISWPRKKFRMTFTADTYGEDFLESGELDLYEEDPEHPCNIRLKCQNRIFWLAWFEGGNIGADYFGLLDMQVRMSEQNILIGLICRWGQEENCYSRAGVDIVKPLQGANLKTEGSFSFRWGNKYFEWFWDNIRDCWQTSWVQLTFEMYMRTHPWYNYQSVLFQIWSCGS